MKRALNILFLALALAAIGQAGWQHGRLPERVATHFNGSGVANGWMSRGPHTAWHVGTVLFMTAIFQGIAFLQAKLPKELVNIPHRDHWLAPEHAAATSDWIAGMVLLMGCAVMLFFIGLFNLVYRANLAAPARLEGKVWWYAGCLLASVGVAVIVMIARFARRPAA